MGFRDGLSVREIASQLKMGVPSVKAFKKRLRKQLKIDPSRVPAYRRPLSTSDDVGRRPPKSILFECGTWAHCGLR